MRGRLQIAIQENGCSMGHLRGKRINKLFFNFFRAFRVLYSGYLLELVLLFKRINFL